MKDVRTFYFEFAVHRSDVCLGLSKSHNNPLLVSVVIGDDEGYTWFDFYSVSNREFSHFLKFGMVWVAQEYEIY